MFQIEFVQLSVCKISGANREMWKSMLVLYVFIGVFIHECLSYRPDYIKPCSKSAADFQKCCVDHGNQALPFLLKGDKQFKIPSLLPLRFPKVDVDAGQNLKIALSNVDLFGLNSVKLTDMNVDFGQQTAYLDLHADYVSLIGEYDVDGKIMVLPIKGNGPFNITAEDGQFKYSFSYKLENRGGIDYAIIQDGDKLDFQITKAYFKLDNLFNGNKAMGDNVNNFLNENQQDVFKELGGVVSETITKIARRVGGSILQSIPFNDLFLD